MAERTVDLDSWHLDKRLPIALIATILIGFSANLWATSTWVARTDSRVAQLEEENKERKGEYEKAQALRERQADKLGEIANAISTLNAKQDATQENVKDLKGAVDNLTQRVLDNKVNSGP